PAEGVPFRALGFAHDGRSLAANHGKRDAIRLWDAASGKERLRLIGSREDHTQFCFSKDDKLLAAAGGGGPQLGPWDLTTGKQVRRFPIILPTERVELSPDSKTAYVECRDGAIQAWDVASGKHLPMSADPISAIRALRFDASGQRLIGNTDIFRAWN